MIVCSVKNTVTVVEYTYEWYDYFIVVHQINEYIPMQAPCKGIGVGAYVILYNIVPKQHIQLCSNQLCIQLIDSKMLNMTAIINMYICSYSYLFMILSLLQTASLAGTQIYSLYIVQYTKYQYSQIAMVTLQSLQLVTIKECTQLHTYQQFASKYVYVTEPVKIGHICTQNFCLYIM